MNNSIRAVVLSTLLIGAVGVSGYVFFSRFKSGPDNSPEPTAPPEH